MCLDFTFFVCVVAHSGFVGVVILIGWVWDLELCFCAAAWSFFLGKGSYYEVRQLGPRAVQ